MSNPRPPSAAVAALDSFTPRAPDELVFLPLGGTGEIGMNLNLYGHAGKWLMIDCGVTFGDDTTPGSYGGWCQPYEIPSTPNPSWGAEAFMDTPVVNGTAYPTHAVDP